MFSKRSFVLLAMKIIILGFSHHLNYLNQILNRKGLEFHIMKLISFCEIKFLLINIVYTIFIRE